MRPAQAPLVLIASVIFAPPALSFELLGAVWESNNGPIVYNLEPSGSDDVDDGSDLEALRTAFRKWACVEGTSLRFREGAEPGVKSEANDGLTSIYFEETAAWSFGPATLGVASGADSNDPDNPAIRTEATIQFNGFDFNWSTTGGGALEDVETVALHEIGHLFGLAHACADFCPELSVMSPTTATVDRELKQDDIDAVTTLYPAVDDSTCQGPFREGEFCACDDECVGDLVCAPDEVTGGNLCSRTCSAENTLCPAGSSCLLDAAGTGLCRRDLDGLRGPGAVCADDNDCDGTLCLPVNELARTVCLDRCEADNDCELGFRCRFGACLIGNTAGIECPEVAPSECSCRTTTTNGVSALLALAALAFALRRRA